ATSAISINGSMRNMRNPEVEARVEGHVSTADIRSAGNVPIPVEGRGVPKQLDLFTNATVSNNMIRVSGMRVNFGQTHIEASGPLKDPGGTPNLQFKAELALRELALLAASQGKAGVIPGGVVRINGTAS